MNMNLTKGLLGLGALLIASQVNAETISLTPSTQTVNAGDAFSLTVQGTDFFNDVSSGGVELSWDPALLTMTSTTADISASLASNGFPIDFGVNTVISGSSVAVGGTFGTVFGPTFDFVTFNFTANSSAPINIFNSAFGDWQDGQFPQAQSIPDVTFVGAQVNVNPVPVPAAVWLFGSGLIGLVGIARRKTQLA